MRHVRNSNIVLIILYFLAGCKPDFPDYSAEVQSGKDFLYPDNISLVIGKDELAIINGIDSCFVQLIDGEDVVEMNVIHVVGDKYFFGGITSYLQMHPIATGEAHCRLFNNSLRFDTTITISIAEEEIPQDTVFSEYTFYPEDRRFPITLGGTRLSVIGPKIMGKKIMDKFILSSSTDGSQDSNSVCTSWIDIRFNYVGTACVKFYNEDFDTLIRVDVLPTYNTFEEPKLDFNDTRDSVVFKLGNPQIENPTDNYLIYNCQGENYPYTLKINLTSFGVIKDYEVAFADEEAKAELKLFIEERYKKMSTWNGYYIYARAFDTTYPSLYDSNTKALVENFSQGKVIYKNPENYPNW